MKWAMIIASVLALIVATAWFVGSRLPADHVATVSARYLAPPAAVWAKISDPVSAATWRTELQRVELLAPRNGHVAWREISKRDAITYEMIAQEPLVSQVSRITDESLPFGGQWEYRLTPDGTGTTLTITERGVVKSALFRTMSRTVFSLTGTMEAYHRSLATALHEPARITSSAVEH
jgi:hypothetical protein